MNNIIKDINVLVKNINSLHDKLLVKSVKNQDLRDSLDDISEITKYMIDLLNNINKLNDDKMNLYICFDNNIYLSVINKKYVISRIIDKDVKVLDTTSNLQKALEIFYCYAYNKKRSKLRDLLKLFRLS